MSFKAYKAIEECEIVVGYHKYLELVSDLIQDKKMIETGMTQEIVRCQAAVEAARSGKNVAMISSGDPGIYGMAGLVLELTQNYPLADRPKVHIIPGISAVGAAAAILGAPLMHDFAVISLSNILTEWEVIRTRVEMAAKADFVLVLYNPKSKRRVEEIEEVREIVLKYRLPDTPVGIVRQATRKDEMQVLSTLHEFTQEYIDMFSLVIIGNRQTYIRDGKMITPRGYSI